MKLFFLLFSSPLSVSCLAFSAIAVGAISARQPHGPDEGRLQRRGGLGQGAIGHDQWMQQRFENANFQQQKIGLKLDQIRMRGHARDVQAQKQGLPLKTHTSMYTRAEWARLQHLRDEDDQAMDRYSHTLGSKQKWEESLAKRPKLGKKVDDAKNVPPVLQTPRENPHPNQAQAWSGSFSRDWKGRQEYHPSPFSSALQKGKPIGDALANRERVQAQHGKERVLGKSWSTTQLETDSQDRKHDADPGALKTKALSRAHSIGYPKEISEDSGLSNESMDKLAGYQ